MRRAWWVGALAVSVGVRPLGAHALGAQQSTLTLDRIFGSREFAVESFGPARWIGRGGAYTTLDSGAIVRYDAASGARTVLVPASAIATPIEDYDLSPDGSKVLVYTNAERVWRQRTRGDYFIYDVATHAVHKLGGTAAKPSTLMFATFSPDGRRVAYVREHNLYVEDIAGAGGSGAGIVAPTTDGSPTTINGTFDWVYEEELSLRDGFRWSPDGTKIAYWQLDASGVRDYDLIDDTDSLYSFVVPVQYPKAGGTNAASRVGIVAATGGPTMWLQVPGDPRQNYIARMDWAARSDEVVLQHLDRRQHTLEVMLGSPATGAVRTVVTEHDSAWVDVVDDLRWLDGGKRFLWVSDRDGWRHAYSIARDGSDPRLVTLGSYDLAEPDSPRGAPFVQAVDDAAGMVYFTASPSNAAQLYLYRARLDGRGKPERVTPAGAAGFHHYQVSPDGRWAFHTFSTFDTPPVVELIRLPSHEVVRTLVDNARLKATVAALSRSRPEFFHIDSGVVGQGGGFSLDGWMLKPPAFDSTRKYPILFFVYGGSWDQTVLDKWSSQNLWHRMLAQQGYLVASIDNRGTSAPKGRSWRKIVYGRVGVIEARDQATAVEALERERPYVDATRVAIWGWSNGGTMTLHALFRYPALYGTGMAVAPVTDQRVYDTIYSERLMGLPAENVDGYTEASPITYADSLRGNLLLVHGSGDDNVHFQNSELLINKLVEADKPFSLMVYPNRTHCICEGPGTRKHVFELLTRYLLTHVPVSEVAGR